jgi:hypothetical protein
MSLGVEKLNWQLQNNGKKGNRRCKEYFMCDLSDSEIVTNPLPGYD